MHDIVFCIYENFLLRMFVENSEYLSFLNRLIILCFLKGIDNFIVLYVSVFLKP